MSAAELRRSCNCGDKYQNATRHDGCRATSGLRQSGRRDRGAAARRANNLQPDRQSGCREAGGNTDRWLAGQVKWKREGQPLKRLNHAPFDLLQTLDVKGKGRHGQGRREWDVVAPHEPPHLVGDSLARHHRTCQLLGGPVAGDELDDMRRHFAAMLSDHRAQAFQVAFQRYQSPEPGIRVLKARMRLVDAAAQVTLEHPHRLAHDAAHLWIDRGIAPVGAVGDAEAL